SAYSALSSMSRTFRVFVCMMRSWANSEQPADASVSPEKKRARSQQRAPDGLYTLIRRKPARALHPGSLFRGGTSRQAGVYARSWKPLHLGIDAEDRAGYPLCDAV